LNPCSCETQCEMSNRTPIEHVIAEIRNSAVCLIAILKKFDMGQKTLTSVWYEVGEETKRIEKAREVLKIFL